VACEGLADPSPAWSVLASLLRPFGWRVRRHNTQSGTQNTASLLGPPEAVFVQVASPSRERVEQYRVLREEVEGVVGRINGDHGTLGQPAVHYLHR
jgi:hypothetical protein